MELKDKIEKLPTNSGVYIFKDKLGRIIYIGKAKNLRNRVRSYFQAPGKDINPKIAWLRNSITDMDYIIVNSPVEALILESTLIRRHKPYFNAQRKDDKRYPYIEITQYETYPRMRVVRRPENRRSRYFGPYTSSLSMRRTFRLVQKAFMVRTCKYDIANPLSRPCLDFHINLCPAPCTRYISEEDYGKQVKRACSFLEGKSGEILKFLREDLEEASLNMEYEKCIRMRDLILSIEHISEKRQVVTKPGEDMDFIGISSGEKTFALFILQVRDGRLLGGHKHIMETPLETDNRTILGRFISSHYREGFFIPPILYLPEEPEDKEELEEWLSGLRKKKVTLKVPEKGDRKEILDMAVSNAADHLEMRTRIAVRSLERHKEELEHLREILGMKEIPHRIEGFDISNISGKMATASMVVFLEGEAHTDHYRRFRIRSGEEPDDFAMMHEALTRRFKNLKLGEMESFREKPDLIVIDGGKGQLSSVMQAVEEQEISGIPIISLAKREEEIYLPEESEPIKVDKESPGLRLIRSLRDEAHRFAVSYHRKLRLKKMEISVLDSVPGIGNKRKETLLKNFDSIEDIKNASLYDLEQLPGFSRKAAEEVLRYLSAGEQTGEQTSEHTGENAGEVSTPDSP